MYIRAYKIVQFVEYSVDDLYQQMSLLVLQSGGHEEREDLVEQRVCTQLPSLLCYLTEGRLWEGIIISNSTT